MNHRIIGRWARVALGLGIVSAGAGLTVAPSYAAADAKIYIVQGLPGLALDVRVDGKTVAKDVRTAGIAGPFKVAAGSRKITFADDGDVVLERMFSVKAKSSWDVVVHLPEAADGDPVVTVYSNDVSPVPKGKSRLVVAHTAAVPDADIRVNGDVLFSNIANGEALKVTVPVATYKVAIVPTGKKKPVILGPISLTVKGGALNRVYAIGDPAKKTMNVAVHVLPVDSRGSDKPKRVDTGTGGQAVGDDPTFAVKLTR